MIILIEEEGQIGQQHWEQRPLKQGRECPPPLRPTVNVGCPQNQDVTAPG